uniref:ATP-dependent Clp protease proteolytic subunit n=1 Tax=Acacia dealbata TaxID=205042 RepID=A0A217EP85_9FABA|nr:clp protease proteolytic subunit [Acacia dealbata]APA32664.1 clp protease proteolytic subunit [Acacia dealbata]
MPVGIPKVPFQGPEEEDASWVDLYNGLFRQRAIFLGERLDTTLGNQIVGLLTYLNIEDPTTDIDFFINSPGGGIRPAVSVYDMMGGVEADVQTICIGTAASMACFLLLGGEPTKRIAYPHARIMMHQPIADLTINPSSGIDRFMAMRETAWLYHACIKGYAQRTRKPTWLIHKDMLRDTFMTPEEAQVYGIIDQIGMDTPEETQAPEIID